MPIIDSVTYATSKAAKVCHGGQVMSISSIGSVTTTPASAKPGPDGNSSAGKAAGSKATKAAKQAKAGVSPKAAPISTEEPSSNNSDLTKLIMLAGQHMSALQIAHRLGIPVSVVRQEAASAGINLNAGSASASSTSTDTATQSANAAIGKGTNVDATA
jgi:hypothetical protein